MDPQEIQQETSNSTHQPKGNGTSIFEDDVIARDDLLYAGRKMTDPINTAEVRRRLNDHLADGSENRTNKLLGQVEIGSGFFKSQRTC